MTRERRGLDWKTCPHCGEMVWPSPAYGAHALMVDAPGGGPHSLTCKGRVRTARVVPVDARHPTIRVKR